MRRVAWWGGGLIVTDDMVMTPVYQHGLCRAVVEAFNAGVDLLLFALDGSQVYRAMACALDAGRRGQLDHATLAASGGRLRSAPAALASSSASWLPSAQGRDRVPMPMGSGNLD